MNSKQREYSAQFVKGWIVFFSIIFGLLLIPTLIFLPVNNTIFQPQSYLKVLDKDQFLDQLPRMVAETVIKTAANKAPQTIGENVFSVLSQEQIEGLIVSVIPAGWIETQTESGITSILDFLNLKTTELVVHVDLQQIKDNLTGPAGKQVFLNFVSTLPSCTFDQLAIILAGLENNQSGEIPLCNPPVTNLVLLDSLISTAMSQFAAALPSEIIFPAGEQARQIGSLTSSTGFKIYRFIRRSMLLLPWACLGFGFLIVLLSIRSMRWMFSSLGIPMILAGMLIGFFGAVLLYGGNQGINSLLFQNSQASFQGIEQLVVGVVQEIITSLGRFTLIVSLASLSLGIILFVVSRILKK